MSVNQLIKELHRRNVFKAAFSYLAVSWLIVQAFSIFLPLFDISEFYLRATVVVLFILFPFWLIFAWIYEYTGSGFRKTEEIELEESITAQTARRMNAVIIASLSVAVILLVLDRYFSNSQNDRELPVHQSLAILPFSDATNPQRLGDFTNAIAFGIHNNLSRLTNISLIPFNDVMAGRAVYQTNRDFVKHFNITDYVSGVASININDTLVNVELLHDEGYNALWSDYYSTGEKDFFNTIVSICLDLVDQLEVEVPSYELEMLKRHPSSSQEAFLLLSKAIKSSQSRQPQDLKHSQDLLLEAIRIDNKFSQAYAELANVRFAQGWVSSEAQEKERFYTEADSLARLAIRMDPDVFTAHSVLASHEELVKKNLQEARTKYQHAIEIHPHDATALRHYSLFLKRNREYPASLTNARKALEYNPISRVTKRNYIDLLLWNKEFDLAKSQLDDYVKIFPKDSVSVLNFFGDYYAFRNDFSKAISFYESYFDHRKTVAGELGYCYGKAGNVLMAKEMIESVPQNHQYTEVNLAMIYTGLAELGSSYLDSAKFYISKSIDLNKGINVICDHPFMSKLNRDYCFN